MEFEWNPSKAKTNVRKHRVSFEEAASVFSDPLATIYEDPDHSKSEGRYLLVGTSASRRLLIVAFAERRNRIRLINACKVTKREREMYEKENR